MLFPFTLTLLLLPTLVGLTEASAVVAVAVVVAVEQAEEVPDSSALEVVVVVDDKPVSRLAGPAAADVVHSPEWPSWGSFLWVLSFRARLSYE